MVAPVEGHSSNNEYQRNNFQIDKLEKRICERKCDEYTLGTRCESSKNYHDSTINEEARIGEFPHMAFLRQAFPSRTNGVTFPCVGSLISPRFVVTAASCFTKSNITMVSLGDYNSDPEIDDDTDPVEVPIKTIHFYPDYDLNLGYNNIVLVELAYDVSFSATIRPSCLWTKDDVAEYYKAIISTIPLTNVPSYTIRKNDYNARSVDNMVKVSAFLIRNAECVNSAASFFNSEENKKMPRGIIPTQMCAREAYKRLHVCQSMLGAPLQILTQDRKSCAFHIIGVTSFGFNPACQDFPTIFTRVSSYLDWIESVVWPEEISSSKKSR